MTPEPLRLKVDWLKLGGAPLLQTAGRLALSSCPGRPDLGEGLAADVAALRAARISLVLSLVDEAEMGRYGVVGLAQALADAGLRHRSFPVVDGLPPRDLPATRALCLELLDALGAGEHVLLHCIGGWGRSGTLAACLLCHEGHSPRAAIDLVRRVRPRCIETPAQELFVHKYAQLQRGFRRVYVFVPRGELAQVLGAGARDERGRRLLPLSAPGLRQVASAEGLTRAILQLHHHHAADGYLVLSGEVAADAPPGEALAVDRAYEVNGPGLLPIPLGGG